MGPGKKRHVACFLPILVENFNCFKAALLIMLSLLVIIRKLKISNCSHQCDSLRAVQF
jgi:hypothetical protein